VQINNTFSRILLSNNNNICDISNTISAKLFG